MPGAKDFLTPLPSELRSRVERHWDAFAASASDVPHDPAILDELARVWAGSEFVALACVRHPHLLQELLASGDLLAQYPPGTYEQRLAVALAETTNETTLAEALRRFRRREMVRIAWRDLAGHSDLGEVVADLSALADACIDQSLQRLHDWQLAQWGTPLDASGRPQWLVVLGMGKLGAHELNFSSDVDLIFAYPEDGETQGGARSITNQEFFIRLGQRLMMVLGKVDANGFVFRVDMRLRPFGEASALAVSFDAMEEYYLVHGREWERYAMIKARVVAGDKAAGQALLHSLKPFIYRRYVDFGAFESLREMKGMIEAEVRRRGMEGNVKLGAGGIREVEFIGQAFQLIRGGREPALQDRRLLPVLAALRELDLLPEFVVDELVQAYVFLRNTEHRIQMFADEQTHDLPEDETGRARLAFSMGHADWAGFDAALIEHRRRVQEHFEQVFAAPQGEDSTADPLELGAVWQGNAEPESALASLSKAGFSDVAEAARLLEQMRNSAAVRALSARGRNRLDRLMPLLLGAVGQANGPDRTLRPVLRLVESIARRTAYLSLLVENPMALSQLVRLCAASAWIAALLARHPLLLDELLDPRSLYAPPRRQELALDLGQRLNGIPAEDTELQMEALRHFKQSNVLRVAAADVMDAVPLMVVSDHLTEIAESILGAALEQAWGHLVQRHGRPAGVGNGTGFAIIGYGKLGGIELGYGSDLDLVFLHADAPQGAMTDGDKPVDNAVFYARLAQRVIHILTARTPSGVLYEVDTRLRPSGTSGLLVTSLSAFEHYQQSEAWTWEHQALARARVVAGDPPVGQAFDQLRRAVLTRQRDLATLRSEVREMRERMRASLSKSAGTEFDLKQDLGGIADIEFMVQYGVLAWAHSYPDLLNFTDNMRQLEGLARHQVVSEEDVGLLGEAYRIYRAQVHRLTLLEEPAVAETGAFAEFREGVIRIWRQMMED